LETTMLDEGDVYTVLGNSGNLSRWGHQFGGWKIDPAGEEADYQPGDTLIMGNRHVMLFPHWAVWDACTITYHDYLAQYGEAPQETGEYYPGDEYAVLGNSWNLYREGYSFSGWRLSTPSSGTVYVNGDTITLPAHTIDFYPVWSAK
jgi:hypothetical protein